LKALCSNNWKLAIQDVFFVDLSLCSFADQDSLFIFDVLLTIGALNDSI